jgi:hypothetical protein
MRIALRILTLFITIAIIFSLLTLITQIGGIIFLLTLVTFPLINRKINSRLIRFSAKVLSFIVLYSLSTLIAIPILAKQYNRVPLPMFETNGLKPRTIFTCILNRHYCKPQLRTTALSVAGKMQQQYPGTVVNYLDSSFPLGNNFPLFGHLSHGDGRKLDVAFHYIERKSGKQSQTTPSFDGYLVYEGPLNGEFDQQQACRQKGFKDLNYGSGNDHTEFLFDGQRTRSLTNFFASEPAIEKIFIEPHLETRLGLTNPKVRFQGCHAARHDDHIHVQVK